MIIFSDRSPSVSVVMPVYNGDKYLIEAIQSILNQTFYDFEIIIIDDGSKDKSRSIVKSIIDRRIVFIQNSLNRGNYCCRNYGMQISKGKYICVMDADDISEPERLQKQFQFMEDNSEIGICGTFIRNIPSNISPRFITDCEHLKVAFLSNNFCSHPSLIMRKVYLDKYNLHYNEDYYYSADFDLCARGFRHFKIENIPEVLLQYRRHKDQISSAKFDEQTKYADDIRINQLIDVLGFDLEEIPVLLHLNLMKRLPLNSQDVDAATKWIRRILEKNNSVAYYKQEILEQFLFSCINYSVNIAFQNSKGVHR